MARTKVSLLHSISPYSHRRPCRRRSYHPPFSLLSSAFLLTFLATNLRLKTRDARADMFMARLSSDIQILRDTLTFGGLGTSRIYPYMVISANRP